MRQWRRDDEEVAPLTFELIQKNDDRLTERSSRSHPNTLHRLEQLAFRLDAPADDDFGFLNWRVVAARCDERSTGQS